MAKSSQSRCISRYLHHIVSKPLSSSNTTGIDIFHFVKNDPRSTQKSTFSSWVSTNFQKSQFSPSCNTSKVFGKPNPNAKTFPGKTFLGFRYMSFKNHDMGSTNFAKYMAKNPAAAVKNTFSQYKEAFVLQIEAFWKRNYLMVLGGGGVVVCILLWRVLFGIANAFVGFSEGMAKYGFLALSCAIVAFTGLYYRSRLTINPDKVYRMAMRKLNTSAGILEVMGAPLTGTDLRAYVMSAGGISLRNFQPRLRSKRCFLIFPISGSERKGLVSVEVKKKKGKCEMKLLAVDVPMAGGPDQRLFLIGDEEEYRIGGGLISELRDPVVKALAAAKEFEDRDELEDEEDAAREIEEAEAKNRQEIENLEKLNSR